jgi:hypothetical protein
LIGGIDLSDWTSGHSTGFCSKWLVTATFAALHLCSGDFTRIDQSLDAAM